MKVVRKTVEAHGRNLRLTYITCNCIERRAIRKLIAAGRTNLLDVSRYPAGLTMGVHFLVAPKGKVHVGFRLPPPLPKWLTTIAGRRFNWIDISALSVGAITFHPYPVTTALVLGLVSFGSMLLDRKLTLRGSAR